jgi:predicted SpoU family rRNA methylase
MSLTSDRKLVPGAHPFMSSIWHKVTHDIIILIQQICGFITFSTFVFLVGHGLSDGDRVHLTRGSTYVDDVVQHVNEIKQRYPNVPVFVVGHSLVNACVLYMAVYCITLPNYGTDASVCSISSSTV